MNRSATMLGCFILFGLTIACGGGAPVMVPGTTGSTISRGAMRALERRWPNVELGATPSTAPCPSSTTTAPTLVTGDFNGDGTADAALWITASGAPRLVALFARLDGEYTVTDLGEAAAATPGALDVGRRGTRFQDRALVVDSFFGLDTILVRACGQAPTGYFWTGDAFRETALAN